MRGSGPRVYAPRMRTPARALVVVALAPLLLLAACSTADPEASPSPSASPSAPPSASPEPSASASPTAPAAALPALVDLVIGPGSLGPLSVGGTVPPSAGAAIVVLEPDYCAGGSAGIPAGSPDAERWVAAELYRFSYGGLAFGTGVEPDGTIGAFQVLAPSPIPTAEGVIAGTPLDHLLSLYPTLSAPIDAVLTRLYVLDGPDGILVFEVAWEDPANPSGYWSPAELDRVFAMTALPTGAQPFAVAATDGGVGGCPV